MPHQHVISPFSLLFSATARGRMGLIVLQNLLESITSRGCEDTSRTLAIAPPPKLLYLYAVWKQHCLLHGHCAATYRNRWRKGKKEEACTT